MIVEVSDKMPYVYGGNDEAVHISDVDLIVESDNQPLIQVPSTESTAVDKQVAEHVMRSVLVGVPGNRGLAALLAGELCSLPVACRAELLAAWALLTAGA